MQLLEFLLRHREQGNLLRPYNQVCLLQTVQQPAVNNLLRAADIAHIHDRNIGMLLTDTINPPDALLNLHGIPAKVKVNQQIGCLQIQTFGGGVRTEKQVDFPRQKGNFDFIVGRVAVFVFPDIVTARLSAAGVDAHAQVGLQHTQIVPYAAEGIEKSGKQYGLPHPPAG